MAVERGGYRHVYGKSKKYQRLIPRLNEGTRPKTIMKVLSGEALGNFLRENVGLIQTRYTKRNIPIKEQNRIMENYGMSLYTKKQFIENFKTYEPNMTLEEINDWYDKYSLFVKSVVTGTEEERKFDVLIDNYRMAAELTGESHIINRVNIILDQAKEKIIDIMYFRKNKPDKKTGKGYTKILPDIAEYYPLHLQLEQDKVDMVISELNDIIRSFGLEMPDDEYSGFKVKRNIDVYTKVYRQRYGELTNVNEDIAKLYKSLHKHEKLYMANQNIVFDTIEAYKFEEHYVRSRFKGKYNKKGQPYIPFVKSSIVRKYIKDK